ncbi:MAG: Do family serine endopeptidase [Muribaculaceae bacterium]|nr:Do family serine endopeptidase [Muribaculaceae bacterium]
MKLLSAIISSAMLLSAAAMTAQENTTATHQGGRVIYQDDFTNTAAETVNGVVSVKSFATPRQSYGNRSYDPFADDPFFEFFFGSPQRQPRQQEQPKAQQRQTGLGSGVIISADGYIVTNNHVIANAERLEVTLNDNRNFTAEVIGADEVTDLALIKIDAPSDLHVIPFGDSENLLVGEWVLAVGNPFGFTSTVTAGIVSAKARNISSQFGQGARGIESYIQTDAAVNSGNSGGALVNLKGELVGINAAIYSSTGNYAGCSFAIPTSIVKKVVSDLKDFGTVQRAYLGVLFMELTPELVKEKDIKGVNSGIYVESVQERSAATEAGLKSGDIIIAIDRYPTLSTAQLQEAITNFSPGQQVTITYSRDGRRQPANVTLRNNQGSTAITRPDTPESLGAEMADADEALLKSLGLSHGVSVKSVSADGRFAEAGMKKNFVILMINGQRIDSAESVNKLYKAIRQSDSRDKVMFISGVYPDGQQAYYAVPLND